MGQQQGRAAVPEQRPVSDAIDVLLCGDRNYFQHMGVAIYSLLANNPAYRFRITVVVDREVLPAENLIQRTIDGFPDAESRFIVFDMAMLARFPVGHHFAPSMYIRLFAPELFADSVERVLYLDGDLVVNGDIGPLWQTDMGNSPIAAVPDIFIDLEGGEKPAIPRSYINSGVLLLNLKQWRAENATSKFVDYIENNIASLQYPDQETLNAVFAGRITYLPYYWNFQADFGQIEPSILNMTGREFRSARRKPGIVHFTSRWKPWMYRHDVHYKDLYRHYLNLTPWRGYVPPDRDLRGIVLKTVKLKAAKRWLRWHAPGLLRGMRKLTGQAGR